MAMFIELTQGQRAVVDDADAGVVREYKWHAMRGRVGNWYARRQVRRADGGQTPQLMHTFITGYPMTDHINGDGLDNRRINLRPATVAQNQFNLRKHRGTSRFKGVLWHTQKRCWQAQIKRDGRKIHLGYFADEVEAAFAYDVAARELFGEYARPNFNINTH